MLVLYTDNLKEEWRLNIIWAAPQSKLNLEVRRKPAYLRAPGNRRGDISVWLIYLSIYFTINFGVKVRPWEKWGRQQMISGEKCMMNYCAHGSTVHFRGSTSKWARGKSDAWDWEEMNLKMIGYLIGRKGGLMYQWRAHWLLWPWRLLLKSRQVSLISLWFQYVLRKSHILVFVPMIDVL